VTTRTQRQLGRIAEAAGITREELRDVIRGVVDEYLGDVPRRRSDTPRITGCRAIHGQSHATVTYVSDPKGTDVVPPGYEPPAGYRGP
jgi:hypothetical protein